MAIAGVSPALGSSSNSNSSTASNANGAGAINQSQFLQLLTTQLQNQDPLNPVSSTDFASQLAQLSTLSGVQQLNTSFQQMIQLQQLGQGAALVGKTVVYGQPGSTTSGQGVVTGININAGQLQLQVGGKTVTSDQITGIIQTPAKS